MESKLFGVQEGLQLTIDNLFPRNTADDGTQACEVALQISKPNQ